MIPLGVTAVGVVDSVLKWLKETMNHAVFNWLDMQTIPIKRHEVTYNFDGNMFKGILIYLLQPSSPYHLRIIKDSHRGIANRGAVVSLWFRLPVDTRTNAEAALPWKQKRASLERENVIKTLQAISSMFPQHQRRLHCVLWEIINASQIYEIPPFTSATASLPAKREDSYQKWSSDLFR